MKRYSGVQRRRRRLLSEARPDVAPTVLMFEDRSLKLDLCALVLVAGVAFLAASLWTYDRFDPPSTLVDPPRQTVQNSCGVAGAFTANFLFESLGFGAYYMLGSLGC